MLEVEREQALTFRVAGHHLHERTDPLTAVAACGLQEYPPGWAAVALHARAHGELDPAEVVTVNAMHGAAHVVPRRDATVFTAALVPDEAGLKAFVGPGTAREVTEAGFTVREALDLVAAAAREGLAAGPLHRDAFHQALRERLPQALLPWCRGCQSHHVRPGLWRRLGPLGITYMPAKATFALADYPATPLDEARAELARRFLRCFGPATPAQLAAWARTSVAHARGLFDRIADELEPVRMGGSRRLVLAADVRRLEHPPRARGVRLLGGFDPYVTQPDRSALVPDTALRKRLFPAVGRPGVVLRDGQLDGLWHGRKKGRRARARARPAGIRCRGRSRSGGRRPAPRLSKGSDRRLSHSLGPRANRPPAGARDSAAHGGYGADVAAGGRNELMAARVEAAPVDEPTRFVIAGDSGAWPDPTADAIFSALVRQVAELDPPPAFFANLGDFAGPGTLDRHDHYLGLVREVPIPNVCIVGNHDLDDSSGAESWERVHGPTNFSFAHGHTRFVALRAAPGVVGETEVRESVGPREGDLAFLDEALERAGEPNRVVLMHMPPHLGGHYAPHADWGFEAHEREFLDLLRRHRVRLVCCAHGLGFDHVVRDGVHFVMSGGGGTGLCSHFRGICTQGDGGPEDRGALFHAVELAISAGGAVRGRVLQAFAGGGARIRFGDA